MYCSPSPHSSTRKWPSLDANLATPETREEVLDGKRVYMRGQEAPYAFLHADLAALLQTHRTFEYRGAIDMLTRVNEDSDISADVSLHPVARDANGERLPQRLMVDILNSGRKSHHERRAQLFSERGVARIFGIELKQYPEVYEWNSTLQQWELLPAEYEIEDLCLAKTLPIRLFFESQERQREAMLLAMLVRDPTKLIRIHRTHPHTLEQFYKHVPMHEAKWVYHSIESLCHLFNVPVPLAKSQALSSLSLEQLYSHLHAIISSQECAEGPNFYESKEDVQPGGSREGVQAILVPLIIANS